MQEPPRSRLPVPGHPDGRQAGAAGHTPDDFAIPRLRDIAERFPNLPLNIEIKGTLDDGIGVPVATARPPS